MNLKFNLKAFHEINDQVRTFYSLQHQHWTCLCPHNQDIDFQDVLLQSVALIEALLWF